MTGLDQGLAIHALAVMVVAAQWLFIAYAFLRTTQRDQIILSECLVYLPYIPEECHKSKKCSVLECASLIILVGGTVRWILIFWFKQSYTQLKFHGDVSAALLLAKRVWCRKKQCAGNPSTEAIYRAVEEIVFL